MPERKLLLTPKELADAIGASESSLRRWVDNGKLRIARTAGGHRRIPLDEAIRFIRESGTTLLHPHLLGLDDSLKQIAGRFPHQFASTADADDLFTALTTGDRRTAKAMTVAWYLAGRTLPDLFDGPLRSAMHRVGELWAHDSRGILIEHRATEICLEMLHELRSLLPAIAIHAPLAPPVAMGGAPSGDPYLVPSLMASLLFAEAGYREFNYGGNTPLHLLADAAAEHGAAIVWVSLTGPVDVKQLRPQLAELAQRLATGSAPLVIGGRHAAEVFSSDMSNVHLATSMADLSALAKTTAASRSK